MLMIAPVESRDEIRRVRRQRAQADADAENKRRANPCLKLLFKLPPQGERRQHLCFEFQRQAHD